MHRRTAERRVFTRRKFIILNAQAGLALAGSQLLGSDGLPANVIARENAKPGTESWRLRASAVAGELEGYASATSVARGESIRFFVNSEASYTLEVFRLGWYGGLGGRRMTDPVQRPGIRQAIPEPDPTTGLVECRWVDPYVLNIPRPSDPAEWPSGFYVAKLSSTVSGRQRWIPFIVRDDERSSHLMFQFAVTRHQAYNNWGGKSLYGFNSTGPQASRVSFDRPYAKSEMVNNWEYQMVRFLEREGYDVAYSTNIDTHRNRNLSRSRAFLSVGHDEYWSWEMRQNVERARDAGIHLGFFSANTCYWQIRLENDDRVIVSYKESALSADPIVTDGQPANDYLATTLWRSVPVSRPEEALIGTMYIGSPVDGDIVIEEAGHWVFSGTGLRRGDRLPGLLGYEVDRIHGYGPPGIVRLTHSPFTTLDGRESDFSNMTLYRAASGAYVFATGSIQWSWGLDSYNAEITGDRTNPAAQQITRNVLNRFIYGDGSRRRAVRHG